MYLSFCQGCRYFHNSRCYYSTKRKFRSEEKRFTTEDAIRIAKVLDINFNEFDVEQFRIGLDVELEHGLHNAHTNITDDDPIMTGKIALAHLNEFPDYYTRLTKMEEEAEEYWEKRENHKV